VNETQKSKVEVDSLNRATKSWRTEKAARKAESTMRRKKN
jgi:hypothetical protein